MLVVDVIIRTPEGVVLIKRKNEPYEGRWALPGGFVRYGERVL
jgi:8-oxo-dGTP diphosphatase